VRGVEYQHLKSSAFFFPPLAQELEDSEEPNISYTYNKERKGEIVICHRSPLLVLGEREKGPTTQHFAAAPTQKRQRMASIYKRV
jgi:hypothetical protein